MVADDDGLKDAQRDRSPTSVFFRGSAPQPKGACERLRLKVKLCYT